MELEVLTKLAGSGNLRDVEQHWMSLIDRAEVTAGDVIELTPVIDEYIKINRADQAESLVWSAIESLKEKRSDEEALQAAKPLLLKLNKNAELKKLTADLYQSVYADREGLAALMEEAGIAGGRPPRRAIRTMDVCLSMKPGSYVTHRDDDSAARVESVDVSDWSFSVDVGDEVETFGPVEFADQYIPCDEDDFRVMARFDPEELQTLVKKKPAVLIESVLKAHGYRLDSDELREILTRGILPASDWTKWWTKARAAIKRAGNVRISGRSPYELEYIPGGHAFQEEFAERFAAFGAAADELVAFEGFVRDCKARDETPDPEILRSLRDIVSGRADRLDSKRSAPVLAERLVESAINCALGEDDPDRAAVSVLAGAEDPGALIRACSSAALWRRAGESLKRARPQDWAAVLASVFPWSPLQSCEDLADLLDSSELSAEAMEKTIGTIISEASETFPALFWLWDKGLNRERWRSAAPVTVLMRMLSLLGDIQRSDKYPPAVVKQVCGTARTVLSARKYARFMACLDDIEVGMGAALRTEVQRLENLGRKVEEDLLTRIRAKFPGLYVKATKQNWEEEDAIYSTQEGIGRWEAEINELVNVKMRENAKAIGEAAEKGDLSENSEYKFALEERDLLRSRLSQMQQQLAMAHAIRPEDVPTDHVGVGSKISLRHVETGKVVEMTFLSSFDALGDPDIYNYKAPVGQRLMGAKIGDQVELPMVTPDGLYEITHIGPWKAPEKGA